MGPGRVLVLAYGFFTLAAGARSIVQIATHGERAPFAYGLSAFAACVYATGTVLLARTDHGAAGTAATLLCALEIGGVLTVGLLSQLWPGLFGDASVWSGFGSGYGYVPAVLPVLALAWLHLGRGQRSGGRMQPADVTNDTSASTGLIRPP